ncbi:hypothetical protein BS78_06G155700 [Paspalum vaginatum]|nr:hypothetical protein BS78_06G155700 [Paspalum vaginatum]
MELETAGEVDRISELPDHLLHAILVKLPTAAAVSTSCLLSRRWRRVWTQLPALSFSGQPSTRMFDAVDAALAAYSAPWLNRLVITFGQNAAPAVPAARANAWLRFAARRLSGELRLWLCLPPARMGTSNEDHELVDLPACERVTAIAVCLTNAPAKRLTMHRRCPQPLLRLPGPGAGMFAALRALGIRLASLVCEDLGRVVSSEQSPCLQRLELREVRGLDDLCIRSSSLESIALWRLGVKFKRLDIAAPRLLKLLRCLRLRCRSVVISACLGPLLQGPHMERYKTFIKETDRLPRAKILQVQGLGANNHGIAAMLHLLRKCDGPRLRKLKITMTSTIFSQDAGLPWATESCRIDGVTLGSLEEIEIDYFSVDEHFFAFLELLFIGCNISSKRLVICPSGSKHLSGWIRGKIQRLAYPNTYVKILEPTDNWNFGPLLEQTRVQIKL